jgi:hypothetical protein
MASAWALLGEAPGPAELAGAVLLVAGVILAQGTPRSPRPAPARPRPAAHSGASGAGEPDGRRERAAARP